MDVEETIKNTLVKNRGKILLKETNTELKAICNSTIHNIEIAQKDSELDLSGIYKKEEEVKNVIKDINQKNKKFNDFLQKKEPVYYKSDVIKILNDVRTTVSEKIDNADLENEALHRYIYDNLKNWYLEEINFGLSNLANTDKDISILKEELSKNLKDLKINLNADTSSIGVESIVTDAIFELENYEPHYIPSQEEKVITVSDSVWYKPFTWFRKKRIVVQEKKAEEFIYDSNQIKKHYKAQIDVNLPSFERNIESYCLNYYEKAKQTLSNEVLGKLKKALEDRRKTLDFIKKELSKGEAERNKLKTYFESQKKEIEDVIKKTDKIDLNIEQLTEELDAE